jgi:hypothetical protein
MAPVGLRELRSTAVGRHTLVLAGGNKSLM